MGQQGLSLRRQWVRRRCIPGAGAVLERHDGISDHVLFHGQLAMFHCSHAWQLGLLVTNLVGSMAGLGLRGAVGLLGSGFGRHCD
jgi:hypothetical protein